MAEEERPYEKTIAQLAGEVAALRQLVAAIILELPERAMLSIASKGMDLGDSASRQFLEPESHDRRQFVEAIWTVVDDIEISVDQQIEELATGDKLRTIQPFPLDPEHHLPGRNF